MTLALLVRRSLRQHALSTLVTALSIALAGGLVMSVWVVKDQSQRAFTAVDAGFDAVLGARGAKLQLVLSAIFHLEDSSGNLSWTDYLEIQSNPNVEVAIPTATGDNYLGYRIVGTTTNLFSDVEYAPGRRYTVRAPGRVFDPDLREAVVGSFVAERLRLRPGDRFQPYHGLRFSASSSHQHGETYVVVGVLDPSNTPADRVIWIPLRGVQLMSGHDPKAADELSAVLIKLKGRSPLIGRQLDVQYNREDDRLTFAWPIALIIAQLFDRIAWFERVLAVVAYLVVLVATGSVLASIHNSMNERQRDFAILRALGAHRRTVFGSIILEASTIAVLGMITAFLVYAIIATAAAQFIRTQTGVVLNPFELHPVMVWAPLGMIGLSGLAGVVPAWKAYGTEVAKHLAPRS
jgi:putative ABC transport system permease protein